MRRMAQKSGDCLWSAPPTKPDTKLSTIDITDMQEGGNLEDYVRTLVRLNSFDVSSLNVNNIEPTIQNEESPPFFMSSQELKAEMGSPDLIIGPFQEQLVYENIGSVNSDTTMVNPGSPSLYINMDSNSGVTSTDDFLPHEMPAIPEQVKWPGTYGFTLSVDQDQDRVNKSVPWTYSKLCDTLLINMDQPCFFRFHVHDIPPQRALRIRATPIFTKPEDIQKVVKRCGNHSMPEHITNKDVNFKVHRHLIRCDDSHSMYEEDNHGRFSVTVPYTRPEPGTNYSRYLFRIMCLNSCPGELERKQLKIVFTLEDASNNILGRQTIGLRCCACPGRDRQAMEKHFHKEQQKSTSAPAAGKRIITVLSEDSATDDDDNAIVTMEVRKCEVPIVQNFLASLRKDWTYKSTKPRDSKKVKRLKVK